MLDGERFRHHRANTAGTGEPREGHQQVAEQWEQRFHSERNFNPLSTIRKSPFISLCQNQQFAAHRLVNFHLSVPWLALVSYWL